MKTAMTPILLERLACPKCGQAINTISNGRLVCKGCGTKVPVVDGKPIFTPVPPDMKAAPKIERGPDEGSTWRQANWRFLEKMIDMLPSQAVILDFGAGHGDFSQVLQKRSVVALDIFPYDEVDLVCDLQKAVPFIRASFDAIILMNVLEHVQQPEKLMKTLARLLRPRGLLIVAVPFLLKLHQQPYDFYRYSHQQLENLGDIAGLDVVRIEGYYDPGMLMKESVVNVRCFALPGKPLFTRVLTRLLMAGSTWLVSVLVRILGAGHMGDPSIEKSPYPIGYHVVYRVGKEKKKQR